jgi:two-component system nitrogen regulation response regulator GlnG
VEGLPEQLCADVADADQLVGQERLLQGQTSMTRLEANGVNKGGSAWEPGLEQEALALLNAGRTDVWDALTRRFETSLIQAALATTRGRRIEAAHKLGIGRNTITRKIQELGLDEA